MSKIKPYPDQSFVNLGDSFSVNPSKSVPSQKMAWPSTRDEDGLQEKYDQLKEEHSRDKSFYDKALEARTNQLEAADEKNEKLEEENGQL